MSLRRSDPARNYAVKLSKRRIAAFHAANFCSRSCGIHLRLKLTL